MKKKSLNQESDFFEFVNKLYLHSDHIKGRWNELAKVICKKAIQFQEITEIKFWEFDEAEQLFSELRSAQKLSFQDFSASHITDQRQFSIFILCGHQVIGALVFKITYLDQSQLRQIQNFSRRLVDLLSHTYLIQKNNEIQNQLVLKSKLASLGEISADILHEVANPLHTMNSFIETCRLEMESGETEAALDHLVKIEKFSRRVLDVFYSMRNMLTSMEESPVDCRLTDMLDDVQLLLGGRLDQHKIILSSTPEFQNVQIKCLRSDTTQILMNLISNAIDAIKNLDKRWIRIEYLFFENVHTIRVIDSGSGISSSVQEKIFTPFFSTKRNESGTGIGLALCRKLVEKQGGRLDINPKSKNTEFIISLPKAG